MLTLDISKGGAEPAFFQLHSYPRLRGVLPIGFHVHLMDRSPDGNIVSDAIEEAERDADRLALELLAPSAEVLGEAHQYPPERRREALVRSLGEVYSLPPTLAAYYALLLAPKPQQGSSFIRRLGIAT